MIRVSRVVVWVLSTMKMRGLSGGSGFFCVAARSGNARIMRGDSCAVAPCREPRATCVSAFIRNGVCPASLILMAASLSSGHPLRPELAALLGPLARFRAAMALGGREAGFLAAHELDIPDGLRSGGIRDARLESDLRSELLQLLNSHIYGSKKAFWRKVRIGELGKSAGPQASGEKIRHPPECLFVCRVRHCSREVASSWEKNSTPGIGGIFRRLAGFSGRGRANRNGNGLRSHKLW